MTLRAQPLLAASLALFAVVGSAHVAVAGECGTDADCGQGFECDVTASGTGGASGSGGGAVGGTAGTASAGSGGAGTSGFAPPREVTCGDGLCQASETATTCVIDCTSSICVLAQCDTNDDCAEGYECEEEALGGTGGASGPVCGDGLCTSGETLESCPDDCTVTRRCAPAGGRCTSDASCAPGFYCSFVGSGAGGGSSSGSTGAGGFPGGSAGTASGGSAPASGGAASGGTGNAGSGDALVAAGTCMPLEDGSGGTTGSGGSVGTGGAGSPGVGGTTGGTGFGGSGALGSGATGGVGTGGSTSTGGTSGTGNGGTSGGTSGSGGGGGTGGSSGSANGSGGTGTGAGGTGMSEQDPGGAERGGCAIAAPRARAPFAELGVLLLVGLGVLRRRRER
jgi:hypothetical protein